jgi:hypothetical protein
MSKAVGGPPAPILARPAGKESASSGSFLAGPACRRRGLRLSDDTEQRERRSTRAMCEAGAGKRRPEAIGHGCGASFCEPTRQPSTAAARRGVRLLRRQRRSPTLARSGARSAQAGRHSAKAPAGSLAPSGAGGPLQRTFVRHSRKLPCCTKDGASRFWAFGGGTGRTTPYDKTARSTRGPALRCSQ